jgi:ATP-dependent DNA helicase PIF1
MNFEQSFNPSTIHRWSLVANNEEALHKIKSTDTLIIDEISMFSCKLFDQLHSICCLKDGNKPWGGIQIIVSGDFNQLPPTPNRNYNDDGVFCFKSDYFKSLHHVTLNTVVRQSDRPFIEVIRRVSTGMNISEEIVNYMKTLERPLHEENSLKLFARNDLVSAYNRKLLINQPGEIYEYKATDTGDRSKLQNVTAQGILWLKENSPVVLIRNISSTLVNGLQGTVIKCEADGPTVHFPAISSTVKVKKISFSGKLSKEMEICNEIHARSCFESGSEQEYFTTFY